jgi:hypothetical protein
MPRRTAAAPAPNAKTGTLLIPFAVIVDPATDKVSTNLATKKATVSSGTLVVWDITNTLPKTIKVDVIGLDSSMAAGFKSTVTVKSGDHGRIQGTVTDPGGFSKILSYGLWVTVGGKQVAVDPDLQVEPPPGMVIGAVDTTNAVTVSVTIDSTFTPSNDPDPLKANADQAIEWTISNNSGADVNFAIAFPHGEVAFVNGLRSAKVANGKSATLQGKVAKAAKGTYKEAVFVNGLMYEADFDFTFA